MFVTVHMQGVPDPILGAPWRVRFATGCKFQAQLGIHQLPVLTGCLCSLVACACWMLDACVHWLLAFIGCSLHDCLRSLVACAHWLLLFIGCLCSLGFQRGLQKSCQGFFAGMIYCVSVVFRHFWPSVDGNTGLGEPYRCWDVVGFDRCCGPQHLSAMDVVS